MESENILKVRNLKTYFYTDDGMVLAVDDVNLNICRGETLGLVGESGCGKTTLALSIMRLISPPGKIIGGSIFFDGVDLLKIDEDKMNEIRGNKISMIFQDPMNSLNPIFKIGDQVIETILRHQDVSKAEAKEHTMELIEKVGIADAQKRYSHYPHEFSGGMRQRIMIAMGLSCEPNLIIADEPTTSLDVTIQAQILELMKALIKEFKSSILLVTHDLGVIAEMSNKVAVMYAGKIVEYGNSISIFTKPKHPYTKALLGSIPSPEIRRGELEVIRGSVPSLINPPTGCRFHPRCKYALEPCSEHVPESIEIEPNHFVACLRAKEELF